MTFKPSKINANIVARVVAPAEKKFDGNLTELRLVIGHRKKDQTGEWVDNGATWLTYAANGEYGNALDSYGKGDLVEITDAVIETRTYPKKDGGEGLGITARFGTVELLESKSDDGGF